MLKSAFESIPVTAVSLDGLKYLFHNIFFKKLALFHLLTNLSQNLEQGSYFIKSSKCNTDRFIVNLVA